jgi:transcriptional regulator
MTIKTLLWVLLVPVALILWFTESQHQRIHRLRSYGWSQQRIATHLHTTRHQVRRALASL